MQVQEFLFVAAVLMPQGLRALRYSQGTGDENCETLKSEIHLIKEEFDELGRMQRTCNADVIVLENQNILETSAFGLAFFLRVNILLWK